MQSQTEKPKANLEEMRRGSTMLTVGVVGLVILALMTLYVAIEMTQMSAEARNISYWPLFVMPVYLILGGVSLAYSARASVLYKKDLHVVSAACLVGLVLAFLGQFLWVGMIFVWLIYYGILFWWLMRRRRERAGYLIHAEQLWMAQNGGNKSAIDNRARRTTMVTIVVAVASFLVPTLLIAGFFIAIMNSPRLDTATVRDFFEKSAYARSPYFTITEKEVEKAKNDRIYLRIDGLQKEARYECDASFNLVSVNCRVIIGDKKDGYGESLSVYFWNLHQDEINEILKKYGIELEIRYFSPDGNSIDFNVYNYDEVAFLNFVKDLLEIPDMKKLYLAYQVELEQSSEVDASVAFDNLGLQFYEEEGRNQWVKLFEFAQRRGI